MHAKELDEQLRRSRALAEKYECRLRTAKSEANQRRLRTKFERYRRNAASLAKSLELLRNGESLGAGPGNPLPS
jgi:IS1 family transposase